MSIFSSFFGDDNFTNIDNRIDSLVNQFPLLNQNIQVDSLSGDFINSFIEASPKEEIDKLLQSVTVSRDRLERYNIYDEAYRYVPIIKRMLKVYIANILQKNPVTGKSLLVRESSNLAAEKRTESDNIEKVKQFTESCINVFDLILKLRNKILPIKLVYGDCFVEVVDIHAESKKKEAGSVLSTMTLFESELRNIDIELSQLQNRKVKNGYVIDQTDQLVSKIAKCLIDIVVTEIEESSVNDEKDNEKITSFDDVLVRIHKPHNIIVLQTEYGSTLGYLEVSKDNIPQVYNLTQTLSTLIGRITSILGRDVSSQENVTDRIVRYVVKQALEKAGKQIVGDESIDDLLSGLDPQVYLFIKRLIVEQGLSQKSQQFNRIKVRFIPASRMVHFTIPSSEYDPYGGSFIDPLVFNSKLYIISQLANIIMKLSRAAPVRKWTIDAGSTQMQPGLIQKLKRELYNTRVTLDDISSFKSIPKILSDFKDMFVLSKGGQKPIDVEIASHGDPTVRIADLQDARQEIMSLSGIPPALTLVPSRSDPSRITPLIQGNFYNN